MDKKEQHKLESRVQTAKGHMS